LQERLEALRKVRATGALVARFSDGRSVTYRSDAEMASAAADLERQITAQTATPVTAILVSATKGLE
jgi:hypothetical protein